MKKCVICGDSHDGRGKTCSMSCRGQLAAQNRRLTSRYRICEVCGTSYRATYSRQRTCGRECGRRLPQYLAAVERNAALSSARKFRYPSQKVFFGECDTCGAWFSARTSRGRFCSESCRYEAEKRSARAKWNATPAHDRRKQVHSRKPRVTVQCAQCFKEFMATAGRKFCSSECSARFYKGFNNHITRARFYGVPFERDITLDALIVRDGGTCGLCGEPVVARWPDHMAASIDHVVPMSKGGSHTWVNVQLAHWLCNTLKGADPGVHFRLEDESCQQRPSSTRPVATAA